MAIFFIYKNSEKIAVVSVSGPQTEECNIGFLSDGQYSHQLRFRVSDEFNANEIYQAREMVLKVLRWKLNRYSEHINPRRR